MYFRSLTLVALMVSMVTTAHPARAGNEAEIAMQVFGMAMKLIERQVHKKKHRRKFHHGGRDHPRFRDHRGRHGHAHSAHGREQCRVVETPAGLVRQCQELLEPRRHHGYGQERRRYGPPPGYHRRPPAYQPQFRTARPQYCGTVADADRRTGRLRWRGVRCRGQ